MVNFRTRTGLNERTKFTPVRSFLATKGGRVTIKSGGRRRGKRSLCENSDLTLEGPLRVPSERLRHERVPFLCSPERWNSNSNYAVGERARVRGASLFASDVKRVSNRDQIVASETRAVRLYLFQVQRSVRQSGAEREREKFFVNERTPKYTIKIFRLVNYTEKCERLLIFIRVIR